MTIDAPQKDSIPYLQSLWKEAFGDTDAFISVFFSTAFHEERCRCLTIDGKLAAALYWFDCSLGNQKIAYLYAIATAKDHRGQGLCHKLMADTHEYLTSLGYASTVLVPGSKELFGFYERMGYRVCSYVQNFSCLGTAETTRICRIEAGEYARFRQKYLPENGVLQENENLDFLQTYAKFYAGEDFLLAAYADGQTLCGIELLGNTQVASAIVSTLGFSQGTFRTPYGDTPFAMFLPLTDEAKTPSYFGLAFD